MFEATGTPDITTKQVVKYESIKYGSNSTAVKFLSDHKVAVLLTLSAVIWQVCAQWVDPRLSDNHPDAGALASTDVTAILYPFVIGLGVIWAMGAVINRLDKDKNPATISNAQIATWACIDIAGWTAGYYVADKAFGLVAEDWVPTEDWHSMLAVGALVGLGSAFAVGLYHYLYLEKQMDNKNRNRKDQSYTEITENGKALTRASMALFTLGAGFLWYISFCAPDFGIGEHLMEKGIGNEDQWDKVARGLFAPLLTAAGTTLMLYGNHKTTEYIQDKCIERTVYN